jgi:predicted phage tail protein
LKLILHGALKDKYGSSIDFNSPTVADALEGFSRQMPDFPTEMLVEAVGFDTPEKLQAPTDVKEVHLIPALFGGSGIGKILVGALLIAIVIFQPAIGALLGSVLTSGASAAVLGAGISLVLSGVMQLFMKAPTTNKSNDPEASKYLGNNKNTTAINTPITQAWGVVKLSGQWLSIQANSNNMVYGTFPATPT